MKKLVLLVVLLVAVPLFSQRSGGGRGVPVQGPQQIDQGRFSGLEVDGPTRLNAPLDVFGVSDGITLYDFLGLPAVQIRPWQVVLNVPLFLKVDTFGPSYAHTTTVAWPTVGPSPRIQDEGFSELASDGTLVVPVDAAFQNNFYLVHLTAYGPEALYVAETHPERFVVKSVSGKPVKFAWRISAKYLAPNAIQGPTPQGSSTKQ